MTVSLELNRIHSSLLKGIFKVSLSKELDHCLLPRL